jgi:hypothetical protein
MSKRSLLYGENWCSWWRKIHNRPLGRRTSHLKEDYDDEKE